MSQSKFKKGDIIQLEHFDKRFNGKYRIDSIKNVGIVVTCVSGDFLQLNLELILERIPQKKEMLKK